MLDAASSALLFLDSTDMAYGKVYDLWCVFSQGTPLWRSLGSNQFTSFTLLVGRVHFRFYNPSRMTSSHAVVSMDHS